MSLNTKSVNVCTGAAHQTSMYLVLSRNSIRSMLRRCASQCKMVPALHPFYHRRHLAGRSMGWSIHQGRKVDCTVRLVEEGPVGVLGSQDP